LFNVSAKGGSYSLDEIKDECRGLITAGFDTTSVSLTLLLCRLASYPDIEQKLRDEIESVIGNRLVPTYEELQVMPYLRMVVKESLRLNNPVAILSRRTLESDVIGDYEVPPQSNVVYCPAAINRNQHTFADACRMKPERFAQGSEEASTVMPFEGGPHMCVGHRLATLEIEAVLCMFYQRFRITKPVLDFSSIGATLDIKKSTSTVIPKQ